jgi:hypothetical protein
VARSGKCHPFEALARCHSRFNGGDLFAVIERCPSRR